MSTTNTKTHLKMYAIMYVECSVHSKYAQIFSKRYILGEGFFGKGLVAIRVQKIYLETTMFNYYYDTERDAHADTVKLFEEVKAGKYLAFTSVYAVQELSKAPEGKRDKMLELISEYGIATLGLSDEAEKLAEFYMREGIIPKKYETDGVHIAVAAVNDLDMIISLNFRHIVKKKTIEMTELVNIREGYRKVQIYTPMEVVENDCE